MAKRTKLIHRHGGDYLFRAGEHSAYTYFLVSGQLAFEAPTGLLSGHLSAGDTAAAEPLPGTSPPQVSARCLSDVACLSVDSALLEVMLSWGRDPQVDVGEVGAHTATAADDWMLRLLQRRTFQQLPARILQAMFLRMSPVSANSGEMLIRQSESGDYFYVIVEGHCRVIREVPGHAPLVLATFGPGDCFGEDSLLSGTPRNASVQAQNAVKLLRLSQADFAQLLGSAWTRRLGFDAAAGRVASGTARWLDVRLPSERAGRHLPDSLNIPLYRLRSKAAELPAGTVYICVCDNGRSSAVAAFILAHLGLEACVLGNGLLNIETTG
ncbi:cyclic nucleotide-binding domain-containing protein [Hydrocarboniphaga sp.]|uniref:cyclic nucleotide-binding domain-containing protein n=1 Tax=Hydrocarboniphaga sp. TaxID=2033016 RepID=UPI002629BA17|nr:cyclic nucleotide-binding domain-containing protein [Hydrocarboniphaga sp.]